MGLKCFPHITQAIMDSTLLGIGDVNFYINEVDACSNDWNHHVQLLPNILCHLHENGFAIYPLKCKWDNTETDWLGC